MGYAAAPPATCRQALKLQLIPMSQVYRHHGPLIYGRDMEVEPDCSTGIALLRVELGLTGMPCYALITYK
jgi:hypothetical protein